MHDAEGDRILVAMVENYRSELIWRVVRRNPYILRGRGRAGFTGGWLDTRPAAAGKTSRPVGPVHEPSPGP